MKAYGRLWPIVIIVALVLMALPNVTGAQEDDPVEVNRALALKYAELRLAGWPDAEVAAVYAEDHVTHAWSLGDIEGVETDRAFMSAMTPFTMTDCQAWAGEEYAVLHCYATGTFGQDWAGFTANQAEWGINIVVFFRIAEGKLAESWFCYNSLNWFQQLGIAPAPEGVTPAPEPQWTITGGETDAIAGEVAAPVLGWLDVLNTFQLSDLEELAADEFVLHDILAGDLDVPNYQDYMTANQTGLTEWAVTTDEPYFVEGDLFFGLATVTGVFSQELNGIPANGNPITLPIFTAARIEDGKLVEVWSWYDSFGFISQLTAPAED